MLRVICRSAAFATIGILVASGCFGPDESRGGDVDGALEEAGSLETWVALDRTGDGLGPRLAYLDSGSLGFVDALVDGGDDARSEMELELVLGFDYPSDAKLLVYAYALQRIGDPASLDALADFVDYNVGGDLYLAPQAATHAIFALLGSSSLDTDTYDYDLLEMRAAVDGARASATGSGTAKQAVGSGSGISCHVRYLLVDDANNPITYVDATGNTVHATLKGEVYLGDPVALPEKKVASDMADVTQNGGVYVPAFDGGRPSRRYNCAGFAFRELQPATSFTAFAETVFQTMTRSGLLREKSGPPAPGDKVFFFDKRGFFQLRFGTAQHVAVVQRLENGKAVVRAPDNFTGVFDAPIDAPYFDGGFRKYEYRVYEWAAGKAPKLIPDPSYALDPASCGSGTCGNGSCEPGESYAVCPGDCSCGDAYCDAATESYVSCPQDCTCGDGTCQSTESVTYCAEDCGVCGDGSCSSEIGEDPMTCSADCGHCGNGICEESLDECMLNEVAGSVNCPTDCCDDAAMTITCPGLEADWALFCVR
jgi:hypothetical protein